MRILIVNTTDVRGGAAKAAFRLHECLKETEIESIMYVQKKESSNPDVIGQRNFIEKLFSYIRPRLDKSRKSMDFFSLSRFNSFRLNKIIRDNKIDLVHFHWINAGFIKLEELKRINIPIIITLHDMWWFTGGCHYNYNNCRKFEKKCGKCPLFKITKSNDQSSKLWNRKYKIFKEKQITIIGLSNWIAEEAGKSSLFKSKTILNLQNPINTTKYTRRSIINKWGINKEDKVITFGAVNGKDDYRKGFDLLLKAVENIDIENAKILVFGSSEDEELHHRIKIPIIFTGHIVKEEEIIDIYNISNAFIVPSRQENLSNAIIESLSCGTPVVAFRIGGNVDIIKHKETGYLADPFKTQDLSNGIVWAIENNKKIADKCRDSIVKRYDFKVLDKKYIDLYKSTLK